MPVMQLRQWDGTFTVDEVRVLKDRLNLSAVTPPIRFVTGMCKVTGTDASQWVELQLSAAESAKLQDIEERILRAQPDSLAFRSSLVDGKLETWLNDDTQYYSADRELLQDNPQIEVGSVVRALIGLSDLSYAKTQFGALWRVEQLWMPRTAFAFDEEEKEKEDGGEDLIDNELPSRRPPVIHPERLGVKPEAKSEAKSEAKGEGDNSAE